MNYVTKMHNQPKTKLSMLKAQSEKAGDEEKGVECRF